MHGCEALTSVTIGESVSTIGNGCFQSTSISVITSLAPIAPSIDSSTFNGLRGNNGILYHPAGSDYSTWLTALGSDWTSQEI